MTDPVSSTAAPAPAPAPTADDTSLAPTPAPPPGNLLAFGGNSLALMMMIDLQSSEMNTQCAIDSIQAHKAKAKEHMEASLKKLHERAEKQHAEAREKKKGAVLNFFKHLGEVLGEVVAIAGLIAATIANPALAPATITLAVLTAFALINSLSELVGSCQQLANPDAQVNSLSGIVNKAFAKAIAGMSSEAQAVCSAMFASASIAMGNGEGFSEGLQTAAKALGVKDSQLAALNIFAQVFFAISQIAIGIASTVVGGGVAKVADNVETVAKIGEDLEQVAADTAELVDDVQGAAQAIADGGDAVAAVVKIGEDLEQVAADTAKVVDDAQGALQAIGDGGEATAAVAGTQGGVSSELASVVRSAEEVEADAAVVAKLAARQSIVQKIKTANHVMQATSDLITGGGQIGMSIEGGIVAGMQRDADKAGLAADEEQTASVNESDQVDRALKFMQDNLQATEKFLQRIASAIQTTTEGSLSVAAA